MKQFLLNQIEFNKKQKRSTTKTIFLEDLEENDIHTAHVIEIVVNDVELMKQSLLERKQLFQRISNKLHKKVAMKVIEAIERPQAYSSNKNSFVVCIAKKCKTNVQMVYAVIKIMKRMMAEMV